MMFIADFFSTFISIAGGRHEQARVVDGLDMTAMLFGGATSPRDEIVFEVAGSVRLPTIRSGDYKLMGEMMFDIANDPRETTDISAVHPEIVERLRRRLVEAAGERPPLGDKPLLMDPPLPYVYGREENASPPSWLVDAVLRVRAAQPREWAPGETPWPQAPKGGMRAMRGTDDLNGAREQRFLWPTAGSPRRGPPDGAAHGASRQLR